MAMQTQLKITQTSLDKQKPLLLTWLICTMSSVRLTIGFDLFSYVEFDVFVRIHSMYFKVITERQYHHKCNLKMKKRINEINI